MPPRHALERFEQKYGIAPSGCWLWQAATNKDGYGSFWSGAYRFDDRAAGPIMVLAHRWSFEHFVGLIPDGLNVLHHCDTPACVNPAHLFLGTQLDNVRDCAAKGRRNQRRGPSPKRDCLAPECEKEAYARGRCRKHYTQWYRQREAA